MRARPKKALTSKMVGCKVGKNPLIAKHTPGD